MAIETPRFKAKRVAQASLASQFRLRALLLDELLSDLPPGTDMLNAVLARHYQVWLAQEFPAQVLPAKILLSNVAAFVVYALACVEQSDEAARDDLFAAFFEAEQSKLAGLIFRTGDNRRYARRYCCVRYHLAGQTMCQTCPLARAQP